MSTNTKTLPMKLTKDALDELPIPVGSFLAVYNVARRQANFYKKTSGGYVMKLVRNKRAQKIKVRSDDFIMTFEYDGSLVAGDPYDVFEREAATA